LKNERFSKTTIIVKASLKNMKTSGLFFLLAIFLMAIAISGCVGSVPVDMGDMMPTIKAVQMQTRSALAKKKHK